jgi:hypothetical protein
VYIKVLQSLWQSAIRFWSFITYAHLIQSNVIQIAVYYSGQLCKYCFTAFVGNVRLISFLVITQTAFVIVQSQQKFRGKKLLETYFSPKHYVICVAHWVQMS